MYDLYNIGPSDFNYGPTKKKSQHRTLDNFRVLRNVRLRRTRSVSYTKGDIIYDNYEEPLVNEFVSAYKRMFYNGQQRCLFQVYLLEIMNMRGSKAINVDRYITSNRVTYEVIDREDIWVELIRLDRMKFCR